MNALPARDAFDSYGINCHFSFLGRSSWVNTDAALGWVLKLGVGSVRQFLPRTPQGRAAVKYAMKRLGDSGVRWCCPVLRLEAATSLAVARDVVNEQLDWLEDNADLTLLDSLPGPNEPNGAGINNWAQATRWAMQALWEETRKRAVFDSVLIQGSPLNMSKGSASVAKDVALLGDVSKWIDRGDVHLYPAEQDPEYLIEERLAVLAPMHPNRTVCVSEGGYSTSTGQGDTEPERVVPRAVASLYAPKHMLVHLLGGRQFFAYELLDEPALSTTPGRAAREAGFGVVDTPAINPKTWRGKPGFEATRRLLIRVRDVQGHTPVDLDVQLSAGDENFRAVLLHRSDGKHVLAIWQAVDLYEWGRVRPRRGGICRSIHSR